MHVEQRGEKTKQKTIPHSLETAQTEAGFPLHQKSPAVLTTPTQGETQSQQGKQEPCLTPFHIIQALCKLEIALRLLILSLCSFFPINYPSVPRSVSSKNLSTFCR